ncbi:MAG TPA: peptidoglycan endopeptidase, partial [Lachnospiraceae bacterium]|nr:peptidoglycan endopeptidase [Lachnospiraceae bacterium]
AVPSGTSGSAIANYACKFVGRPYVWGGTSLTNGADCSGFTMSVYAQFGYSLPHSSAAQSGYGRSVSMSNLQPGDLLFYKNGGRIGHVAIYIGGGRIVHASNERDGIKISSYNYRQPACARRIVG